ncbi:gliding motility-associated ABC transporter substrate-binding protein GldG [Sphingobacterium sp. HJSM2_6]|uniref:gliding motility-associated ABC transporter substrate-binding protein GldG n=1 Tax=Sphingobacterium sp. HJSM2_6 TaxID=3366264 RepID=UPI003BD67781
MFSIFRKEIASYFNSYTGYLAIALFLVFTGLLCWVFPEHSILEFGYANMDGFFDIAPYMFMFLIPAITMRSIAGERGDGTYHLLLSKPISISAVILGKFLASCLVLLLALIPSITYLFSIYYLASPVGNVDIGAIIGSYLGLIFLGIAFVSIGLFSSSISPNSLIAFFCSAFFCFLFYYGFEAVSAMTSLWKYAATIKDFGFYEHYRSLSRGVLQAKDFIYFFSITCIFISASIAYLNRIYVQKKSVYLNYALTFLVFAVLNLPVITRAMGSIDFTADQRFTLSETSRAVLSKLEKDIHITLFLDGDLPNGFTRLRNSTIEMIQAMKSFSNGKFDYQLIDPYGGSNSDREQLSQQLIDQGLYPTNLNVKSKTGISQKAIFPWATLGLGDREVAINLLQTKMGLSSEEVLNNSIQNLEYSLISAIKKITQQKQAIIGFTEGHGEPSDIALFDAMQSLMSNAQVGRIQLEAMDFASLDQLSLMIIAKPTKPFSEHDKYKIDYFVRNGGHVIWAIDPIDASLDHLRKTGSQPLIDHQLNLEDILFTYGARINPQLIADLNSGQIPINSATVAGQNQIQLAPWVFFPILMPTSKQPIIKNLDGIRTEFISPVDTVGDTRIKKELLLTSSPFNKLINPPSMISLQLIDEPLDPKNYKSRAIPVAVLLSGNFPYVFKNRPTPVGIKEGKDLSAISKPAKMLVIGDGDWLLNQVNHSDQSPFPLGWDRYTNQQFANKTFLLNLVDYFLYDESLIDIRNKEVKLRLLDKGKVADDKLSWQLINVILPLVILMLLAIIQQFLRRKKYAIVKNIK